MSFNVGTIDRVLRVLLGLALVLWAILGGPVWSWIGAVFLVTGLFKFCPAYVLLGIKTNKA